METFPAWHSTGARRKRNKWGVCASAVCLCRTPWMPVACAGRTLL